MFCTNMIVKRNSESLLKRKKIHVHFKILVFCNVKMPKIQEMMKNYISILNNTDVNTSKLY